MLVSPFAYISTFVSRKLSIGSRWSLQKSLLWNLLSCFLWLSLHLVIYMPCFSLISFLFYKFPECINFLCYSPIHFTLYVMSPELFCANVLFVIVDMCMKLEARNVVTLRCHSDDNCEYLCPDCGCKCIDTWCTCPRDPPAFTNNN